MSAPPRQQHPLVCSSSVLKELEKKLDPFTRLCSQGRVLFLLEHLGQDLVSLTLIKIRFCCSRQLRDFRHILEWPRAETVPVLQGTPGDMDKQQLEPRAWIKYCGRGSSQEQMMTRLGRAVPLLFVFLLPLKLCFAWGSQKDRKGKGIPSPK